MLATVHWGSKMATELLTGFIPLDDVGIWEHSTIYDVNIGSVLPSVE